MLLLSYDTCNAYDVSLIVIDNNGCLAYDTIPYTVACNSSTDLNISTSEACVNDTVYLITSSINDISINGHQVLKIYQS